MAKITGSALGEFRNKFGNSVTAKWLGINVAKIYQPIVSQPNTNKQQVVRARFGALAKLGKSMKPALRTLMHTECRRMNTTVYGWFNGANWSTVTASSPEDITLNYPDMVLSDGGLEGVTFGTVDYGSSQHLTITAEYTDNSDAETKDENDDVYIIAYVPQLKQALISTPSSRSTAEVSLSVPAGWSGLTCHLWGAVVGQGDNTYGQVSPSVYIGHGEVS